MKRRAQLGTRINPNDPTTGKVLPKYRMGIGSRIAAALSDFGLGFSGHPEAAVPFGPGATNRRYSQDETQRQSQLANVGTQIGETEKLPDENRKMFDPSTQSALRQGQIEKLESQAEQAEPPAIIRQNNQASKIQQDATDRTKLADQLGLKGDDRRDYILTVKFRDPGQQRQATELQTWVTAFRREYKREPTAEEIANRKARTVGTKAQFDKVERDHQSALAKAELDAKEEIRRLKPFDVNDNRPSWQRRQDVYNDLENRKRMIEDGYHNPDRRIGRDGWRSGARFAAGPDVSGITSDPH